MAKYAAGRIASELTAADNAATADAKGDLLEHLVKYIFEKVPSVSLHAKNVLDGPRAHELDLAFWHLHARSALAFLDPLFLVECKASATPVGSAEVGWFVQKLRVRGARAGIIVALNGITGDGHTSAHREVLDALARDGISILLLNRNELLALADTAALVTMLRDKYATLFLLRAVA